ncbi:MAG TPA: branched-chain amino acid ABC transporter permease [Acidisoma sp.]|jgi:urea transport system permease protein|uniref:ABC transporter permease subunit n=1 Tax=Acidisoma sp. TaxID=1872115 RepID=UPI002B652626|nr:branched-chain amino acid ABC transporter permease [Acidisoma sp.]HTI00535.1 branched-chain amino acid ABC transporter permease [Acidisoma sp.]
MAEAISLLYQFGTNAAFLLLAALGLIVILGMMNIINLAHGEFMMLGAYTASAAVHRGVPLPLAVLLAAVAVGVFGMVLERLIVRHFYGRELGALVVTWGISLILAQGALLAFGPFMPPIAIPGGSVSFGVFSFSVYWLVLILLCVLLLVGLGWIYRRTDFGLQARAAMQNPAMARALGIRVNRLYMVTFGLGSALAGLSGALLAPTTSIAPFMGQQFVAPAFITVVVGGGASVIGGALGSSTLLALVETPVSFLLGTFWGSVALLVMALVVIRLLPGGVSSINPRFLPRWAR